jgi:hypothetical protein
MKSRSKTASVKTVFKFKNKRIEAYKNDSYKKKKQELYIHFFSFKPSSLLHVRLL